MTPLIPRPLVASRPTVDAARDDLLVPRFRTGPLARWLQPRLRPERACITVHLDERGTLIWRALGGRRCFGDLVRLFRERFPDDKDPEQRVWEFLMTLQRNRYTRLDPEGSHPKRVRRLWRTDVR